MYGEKQDEGGDSERFWNLMVFKMWLTDREMDQCAPIIFGVAGVLAVIGYAVMRWYH